MGEFIDKEIFYKIKEDLELAISDLYSYLDQIEKGGASGLMEVNKEKLNRLSKKVAYHANEFATTKKIR